MRAWFKRFACAALLFALLASTIAACAQGQAQAQVAQSSRNKPFPLHVERLISFSNLFNCDAFYDNMVYKN